MLQPGDEIDIWVVEHALGQGGMGSVYRCHNRSAKRILAAVKTLDPSLNKIATAKARFVREAEILFALDHPNIVKVRNVRMDAELPYIEMEFVEGVSLDSQILRGPMAVDKAVALFKQAASAVAYMHERGVRHRDIKPSNIILKSDGRLKLVDFGIATEQDGKTLTAHGQTFGSVSYAPPEWIEPGSLEAVRWDVYSLGTVFYEMLVGRFAFPVSGLGTSRQKALQVMIAKQKHPPLDPGPTLPVDLRRLIRAMTRSTPETRLATAQEVLDALEAADLETVDPDAEFEDTPVEAPSSHTWYPGMDLEDVVDSQPVPLEQAAEQAATPRPPETREPEPAPTFEPPRPEPAPQDAPIPPADKGDDSNKKLVLVGFIAALVLLMAGLGWQVWRSDPGRQGPIVEPPAAALGRDVDVVVTGLAQDSDLQLRLGGARSRSSDGFVHHFKDIPLGSVELVAIQGAGCEPTTDQPWCKRSVQTLELGAGEGVHTQTLSLSPLPERQIELRGLRGMTLRLEGEEVEVDRRGRASISTAPGRYALSAEKGLCPSEVTGCSADDNCPAGCSSWEGNLDIPVDGELAAFEIPLPEPSRRAGAEAPATTPSSDPIPEQAPPASSDAAAKAQVSNKQLASWLASHPEWQREAALESGKAAGNYLKGWDGATPPAGQESAAAVNVSWSMAKAYCAGRGGLAPTSASPSTWTEGGALAWHEYRQQDGAPAWVRSDGTVSTAVRKSDAKAFIGFRCSR